MMFKLAYKHTPRDLARRQQAALDPDPRAADLPSLLFGHVTTHESHATGQTVALKGRVSIQNAVATDDPRPDPPVTGVLGSPKPSYYPTYIRQSPRDDTAFDQGKVSGTHKSYMDDDARLRGWKRYPIRSKAARLPAGENENVRTSIRPLPAGSSFECDVHVHNVRPVELGALLWALDFGERTECRHALGQARPFGFGSVSLSVRTAELRTARGVPADDDPLAAAREAYTAYMNDQLDGLWSDSEQMVELVALATPAPDVAGLRMMELKQYQNAKKAKVALPPPGDRAQLRAAERERETDWKALRMRYEAAAEELREAARAEARAAEQARLEEVRLEEEQAEARAAAAEAARRASLPPLKRALVELEAAQENQQHLKLLEAWMTEKGELEEVRNEAAQQRFPRKKNKMWKKDAKKKPIFDWLYPDG